MIRCGNTMTKDKLKGKEEDTISTLYYSKQPTGWVYCFIFLNIDLSQGHTIQFLASLDATTHPLATELKYLKGTSQILERLVEHW